MQLQRTHLNHARELNQMIDRVLNESTENSQQAILAVVTPNNVYRLAERVRRYSTKLMHYQGKNAQNLLEARDALIMALYAGISPAGWANAWCDGSSMIHNNERRAGVGVIVFSQQRHLVAQSCVAQISHAMGSLTAFEAELQAIAIALDTAMAHQLIRIRVHTDNKGLAQLWREHRRAPRVSPIRERAANFARLQICAIPRLHNQAADRLAKQAAASQDLKQP